jgi:hypothetical protein
MRPSSVVATGLLLIVVWAGVAAAGEDLEGVLEKTYRGAWVLTRVDTWSDCGLFYSDTDVTGMRSTGNGSRRFAAGELARVEKVNLKSDRFDLYLVVAEKVVDPYSDGPFTLYNERTCKVQLKLAVAKGLVKAGDPGPVNALIEDALTTFDSAEAAQRSTAWNRRLRDPLPDDYDQTLRRHAAWKAEQENNAVLAAAAAAVEEAARVADRVSDSPSYLAGFAAGVEAARSWSVPSCTFLVGTTFSSVERRPPSPPRGVDDPKAFARGFSDGQLLRFSLEMARRLRACVVVPPPIG